LLGLEGLAERQEEEQTEEPHVVVVRALLGEQSEEVGRDWKHDFLRWDWVGG
jgi:hypothetical protein